MKIKLPSVIKSYGFSIILVISILIGALLGVIYKKDAVMFKPFGDIFLNLLFTAIVPLVFFSISSAVAGMTNIRRLGKIMSAITRSTCCPRVPPRKSSPSVKSPGRSVLTPP